MFIALARVAMAGDLDGWGGQEWGSSFGGPTDPAAAAFFPPGRGSVADLVVSRRTAGLFRDQPFFGVPTIGFEVWYVEGGLAQASFTVPMARTDELISLLTTAMGEPYKETGNRHFQRGDTSVSLGTAAPNGRTWVTIVSVPSRARCLELFSSSCQIAFIRDEYTDDPNQLLAETRAAQDQAVEEGRRRAVEAQEAGRQRAEAAAADYAAKQQVIASRQELENAVRSECMRVLNPRCKAARSALATFYGQHPELSPPTDAGACNALALPLDCWKQ